MKRIVCIMIMLLVLTNAAACDTQQDSRYRAIMLPPDKSISDVFNLTGMEKKAAVLYAHKNSVSTDIQIVKYCGTEEGGCVIYTSEDSNRVLYAITELSENEIYLVAEALFDPETKYMSIETAAKYIPCLAGK